MNVYVPRLRDYDNHSQHFLTAAKTGIPRNPQWLHRTSNTLPPSLPWPPRDRDNSLSLLSLSFRYSAGNRNWTDPWVKLKSAPSLHSRCPISLTKILSETLADPCLLGRSPGLLFYLVPPPTTTVVMDVTVTQRNFQTNYPMSDVYLFYLLSAPKITKSVIWGKLWRPFLSF